MFDVSGIRRACRIFIYSRLKDSPRVAAGRFHADCSGWPEKEICRPLGQGNFSAALEAGSPDGKSLEEMKEEYERLRDKEFAAHVCAEHPRAGMATV
jgi:hypothetical protein